MKKNDIKVLIVQLVLAILIIAVDTFGLLCLGVNNIGIWAGLICGIGIIVMVLPKIIKTFKNKQLV